VRVSDDTREHTIAALRGGCAAGYLSPETFEWRVGRALEARSRPELQSLTLDIPAQSEESWFSRLRRTLRAWRPWGERWSYGDELVPVALSLAAACHQALVVGRSSSCDLTLHEPSVSRRHAEVRCVAGTFVLSDLHSSNGTWLNGHRVERASIRPGDEVCLGLMPLAFER
jgi:hypothetical protein